MEELTKVAPLVSRFRGDVVRLGWQMPAEVAVVVAVAVGRSKNAPSGSSVPAAGWVEILAFTTQSCWLGFWLALAGRLAGPSLQASLVPVRCVWGRSARQTTRFPARSSATNPGPPTGCTPHFMSLPSWSGPSDWTLRETSGKKTGTWRSTWLNTSFYELPCSQKVYPASGLLRRAIPATPHAAHHTSHTTYHQPALRPLYQQPAPLRTSPTSLLLQVSRLETVFLLPQPAQP